MPSYNDVPTRHLVEGVLEHVGRLVLVDDGSDATVARQLNHIAAIEGAELVRREERGGKGSAVRSGIDHLLVSGTPPEAVLVIDADGQHPASMIPRFVGAGANADLVIGDRFGDLRDDAPPAAARERRDFTPLPAHDRARCSGHAERHAAFPRGNSLEPPGRRLRGRKRSPQARVARRTSGGLGVDASNLCGREELVQGGTRFSEGDLGDSAACATTTARTARQGSAPPTEPSPIRRSPHTSAQGRPVVTTTAVSDWRELARREGDGLVVSLSWTRAGDRVEVAVAERMLAEELHVERARARSMPSTTRLRTRLAHDCAPAMRCASPTICNRRTERSV